MALNSMTGFADLAGGAEGLTWVWEARSVNGRGLDLRLRLPEGFEGLDAALRAAFAAALSRGSITVGLRLGQGTPGTGMRFNPRALDAADLLGLRGVLEPEGWAPSEGAGDRKSVV